jgi:hypothetical protein
MATIDSNIALGVRPVQIDYPKQESPMNQMAAIMQLQNAQQTNQLNRQKMEEYTRARQTEGERRNALAGIDLNSPDSFNKVAQRLYDVGDLEGAQKMLGARAELEYKQAQTGKEKAQTSKADVESKVEKTKLFITQLPIIAQNPTDQAIEQWARTLVQNGIMSMEQATAGMQQMLALPPDQRSKRLMQSALTAKDALEQHYVQQDLGDRKQIVAMPKYGEGKSRVVQEDKVGLSQFEKGKLNIDRQRLDRDTGAGNVAHVVTDNQGNVTMINRKGEVIGSKLIGAGKQSATFEKSTQQQKQIGNDRKLAISELEEITKDGGLIDQSTSSYAGKGVDILARTIGTATSGDIAAGQLAPISDLVLKMVPRFEGPQSDKDTASYNRAAGQLSDTTLPAKIRKAAGKEILRLMKSRENQFGTPDSAPAANDIRSQADAIISGNK